MSNSEVSPQSASPRDPTSSPAVPAQDEPRHSPQGDDGAHISGLKSQVSPGNDVGPNLQLYFRSGWTFLIPYLTAYLLYAWLKWPVNPVNGGQWTVVPCLLHVYWALHAIHLILGVIALRSWWRSPTAHRSLSTVLWSLLPWACLALVFWIPGVYLEFPSDPWQHLARTNEWLWLNEVLAHLSWTKSSYFLAYSFIGNLWPPTSQLQWFNAYYTGCCLLLSWQYYRLARTVGLDPPAAFLFVVIGAMTSGNNMFAFHRYYGMSSTVFAQLGAVALIRIAIETVGTASLRAKSSETCRILALGSSGLLLLLLMRFSHVQALGISTLGLSAVGIWRLVEWRSRATLWLMIGFAVLGIAMIAIYPRDSSLDKVYRPQGWLTAWYGFNLLWPGSPAFDRAGAIFGLVGALNLLAGLCLIRRHSLVAALTLLPVVLLCLPCVALPIANALATSAEHLEGNYIFIFHRLLFAVPGGLALVTLVTKWREEPPTWLRFLTPVSLAHRGAGILLGIGLAFFLILPAGNRYSYNRLFHALLVVPSDLSLIHVVHSTLVSATVPQGLPEADAVGEKILAQRGGIITTPGLAYALNSTGATFIAGARKWMTWPTQTPPSLTTDRTLQNLRQIPYHPTLRSVTFPSVPELFTPYSAVARLSKHWLPHEVDLEHATQQELTGYITKSHGQRRAPQFWLEWHSPRDQRLIKSQGESEFVSGEHFLDRGRLDDGTESQQIYAGDSLVIRPVLRTLDGNARSLQLQMIGPNGYFVQHTETTRPSPLGGDSWIFWDQTIVLVEPGEYRVELTGTTYWPIRRHRVSYHLVVRPRAAFVATTSAK